MGFRSPAVSTPEIRRIRQLVCMALVCMAEAWREYSDVPNMVNGRLTLFHSTSFFWEELIPRSTNCGNFCNFNPVSSAKLSHT